MSHYLLPTSLDLTNVDKQVLAFWKKENLFQKILKEKKGCPIFSFFEGPPAPNGKPGIHHMLSRCLKDVFLRYKDLNGYYVPRRAGWDAHGLPIEIRVEKILSISKKEIGKTISIADFNKVCQETVSKNIAVWNEMTEKMGFWIDLDKAYITSHRSYIEKVWSVFAQLYRKNLLYKGERVQPYSPAAGTALSSHELNQVGCYKMIREKAISVLFPIRGQSDSYFLVWTTTPWTLLANTALAVHPNFTYVKIWLPHPKTGENIHIILAEKAFERYCNMIQKKQQDIPIVQKYWKGEDLIGWAYEPVFSNLKVDGKAFEVIPGEFIEEEEGSGIVHIAPTFGEEDYQVACKYGIAIGTVEREGKGLPIVDEEGKYVEEMGKPLAGAYIRKEYRRSDSDLDVNSYLIDQLRGKNFLFEVKSHRHSYPHCWRTDKPVIYYLSKNSWFIKTEQYRDQMVCLNKKISWYPASTGEKRFGNWLENLKDWNVSRKRYWGTPIPIWTTVCGKETRCISNFEELHQAISVSIKRGYMGKPLASDFDPHKPYIDNVILVSDSGKPMYREEDVMDVWFDAGSMPYAQYAHDKDGTEITSTADFILEGVDQTRGWFYTLLALSTMISNESAYRSVLATGLVLDKNGQKMSKKLGNTLDPFTLLEKYGADVNRYYVISQTAWENIRFDVNALDTIKQRFFGTFQHVYQFFAMYANLDKYQHGKIDWKEVKEFSPVDHWIMSRLQTTVEDVTRFMNNYCSHKALQAIETLVVNDLSNWYIRLNRERFWRHEFNYDKKMAYDLLFYLLSMISRLLSPFTPFYSEYIWHMLQQKEMKDWKNSVHRLSFPSVDSTFQDKKVERAMFLIQQISSSIRAIRQQYGLKVRQPLQKVVVVHNFKQELNHLWSKFSVLLSQETNVKEIKFIDTNESIVQPSLKPNYAILGKKYRQAVQEIADLIIKCSPSSIRKLQKEGFLNFILSDKRNIKITLQDVTIVAKDMPGWVIKRQASFTIGLDITLHDKLIREGDAREMIHLLQQLRKKINLNVEDKILVYFDTQERELKMSIEQHINKIKEAVQAPIFEEKEISVGFPSTIHGKSITFYLEKIPLTR